MRQRLLTFLRAFAAHAWILALDLLLVLMGFLAGLLWCLKERV